MLIEIKDIFASPLNISRGEFDVFDLNQFHVTEVEGFSGEQKEQQIALLKSLGNEIQETENPSRFIAYKKREESG